MRIKMLVVVLLAFGLWACHGGKAPPPPKSSPPTATGVHAGGFTADVREAQEATIGYSGGRIVLGDSYIEVPVGAVHGPTVFRLAVLKSLPAGITLPPGIHEVGPHYVVSSSAEHFYPWIHIGFGFVLPEDVPDNPFDYRIGAWTIYRGEPRSVGIWEGRGSKVVDWSTGSLLAEEKTSQDGASGLRSMLVMLLARDVKVWRERCEASGGTFIGYCMCPWEKDWREDLQLCVDDPRPASLGAELRVLGANLGNADLRCRGYVYKLCLGEVETRIRDRIRAINPDVAVLQETFPDERCTDRMRQDPNSVCSLLGQQCERLLPPSIYEVRWTQLAHGKYECTGIKKTKASITSSYDIDATFMCDGNDTGALRTDVSWASGGEAEILNAHLVGISFGNDPCRSQQIHNVFVNAAEAGPPESMIAGDMNTDPYRPLACSYAWDESAAEWQANMTQYHYEYHSTDQPTATCAFAWDVTIDHVVSNAYQGSCVVLDGEPPRLDGGEGMDHYALECALEDPRWAKKWSEHAWAFDVTPAVSAPGLVAAGYTNPYISGFPIPSCRSYV
jgi:endonuclease/exonuclease/phosphatase family metal-dependent hydrolase